MSLYDRVRDGNGWFPHTLPLANFSFAFIDYSRLQLYAEDCIRYYHQFYLFRCSSFSACQIIDLSARFTFVSLATAVLLNLRSATCSSCPSTSRLRCVASFIFFRKSPRPISNARLKMLPLLHLHPINVIIYNGTYWLMP